MKRPSASISEPATALVRGVPDSFAAALRADSAGPEPDVERARQEHSGYIGALEAAGYRVVTIVPDEAHPDCPFVEDTGVIVGGVALATRPGAESRRGEVAPVAAALADWFPVVEMAAPATLDGGDVLQVGDRIFVGRSARTNDAGIRYLAEVAGGRPVVPVAVTAALHLKSVVDVLAPDVVLAAAGGVDESVFTGLRVVPTPDPDANVLRLPGSGVILVAAHRTATAGAVAAAGFEPELLAAGEFAAADGGLTCMSIRWGTPE